MSNPLKRRMAKAALVLAAGAAPVIGSAGGASALALPPSTDLGTLSNLDADTLGNTAESATEATTSLVGEAGGEVLQDVVPAAGRSATAMANTAVPTVRDAADTLAGGGGALAGQTTGMLAEHGVPGNTTGGMPVGLLG